MPTLRPMNARPTALAAAHEAADHAQEVLNIWQPGEDTGDATAAGAVAAAVALVAVAEGLHSILLVLDDPERDPVMDDFDGASFAQTVTEANDV